MGMPWRIKEGGRNTVRDRGERELERGGGRIEGETGRELEIEK